MRRLDFNQKKRSITSKRSFLFRPVNLFFVSNLTSIEALCMIYIEEEYFAISKLKLIILYKVNDEFY